MSLVLAVSTTYPTATLAGTVLLGAALLIATVLVLPSTTRRAQALRSLSSQVPAGPASSGRPFLT